jgi:endonuclease YncB( thermonuclease family)
VVLCSASAFYGASVVQQRRGLHKAAGKLENGDLVRLVTVIDGDTVVVEKAGLDNVTVRILGIKAFESKIEHDVVAAFGRAAEEALRRIGEGGALRVLLNNPPKDDRGRTLATLFSGDQDLGLRVVSEGLVLVYTVYPFPAMTLYLNAQEQARAANRGLWADNDARARAEGLMREWQRQKP